MTDFGLQIPSFAHPDDQMFERTADLARAAEESGFGSVWVMDHFWQLPPLGGPDAPILEGYTTSARSRRARRGCGSGRSSPA